MRELIRAVVRRTLAAAGLARQTDVDRERRKIDAVRAVERRRRDAAAAKLSAVEDKVHAARERLVAERAESRFQRGLHKEYRARLTRLQTELAKSVAAERRLSALFGGYEERLSAQLRTVVLGSGGQTAPLDEIAAVRQFVVGGVMLDVGANRGEASIPRVVLGDFRTAYALEPDPDRFAGLVQNTHDNHLEGCVFPARVTLGAATDPARGVLTLDEWLARAQVPVGEVRFVRLHAPGAELAILHGAASLLQRRDVVWHLALRPGADAAGLGAVLAAHFARLRILDGYAEEAERPTSGAAAFLRDRFDEGRGANLLLFTLP